MDGEGQCDHGRVRNLCKECGSSAICEHGSVQNQFECEGVKRRKLGTGPATAELATAVIVRGLV